MKLEMKFLARWRPIMGIMPDSWLHGGLVFSMIERVNWISVSSRCRSAAPGFGQLQTRWKTGRRFIPRRDLLACALERRRTFAALLRCRRWSCRMDCPKQIGMSYRKVDGPRLRSRPQQSASAESGVHSRARSRRNRRGNFALSSTALKERKAQRLEPISRLRCLQIRR